MAKRMPAHAEGTPLPQWVEAHMPAEQMLWRDPFWNQISFVRYDLHDLFVPNFEQSVDQPVRVVGTHTSKSITLPVYSIQANGVEVRLRNNFYNWVVSIQADRSVPDIFYRLIDREGKVDLVYCEGFKADWVFGSFAENPKQFTVQIWSQYKLYAFLYLLIEGLNLRAVKAESR